MPWSPFEQQHGFSIDGVDLSTVILVDGWRGRLVKVQNVNTAAPAGEPRFTGWCLDKEDLCVAKDCVFREKDRNCVAALLDAQLVDRDVITAQLWAIPDAHRVATGRALAWLASRRLDYYRSRPPATELTIGLGACCCLTGSADVRAFSLPARLGLRTPILTR